MQMRSTVVPLLDALKANILHLKEITATVHILHSTSHLIIASPVL